MGPETFIERMVPAGLVRFLPLFVSSRMPRPTWIRPATSN